MDFSANFTVRTDLAVEEVERLSQKKGKIGDGICFETLEIEGINVDKVTVENQKAAKNTNKAVGEYYTISTGDVTLLNKESFENIAKCIGLVVKKLLCAEGLVLVVCLGNDRITADAIGPCSAKNIIVTRHIKMKDKELFTSLDLGESACIVTGVMGDTGLESAELVKGVADILKPKAVVVVDALAGLNLSRLARTVQITNTGICPGSGVGNNRAEISEKTLGVPVTAVGVPTVVDTLTLCSELVSKTLGEQDANNFRQNLSDMNNSFVCLKETDKIIECMSKLVGYGLNFALHKDMSMTEMDEFLS